VKLTTINNLANNLVTGDVLAFNKLFERYYKNLCLHANDILLNFEVSRDIVQDVFFQIWENRATLPYFDNFETYIYTIVRNRSRDYIKKQCSKSKYEMYIYKAFEQFEDVESNQDFHEISTILNNEIENLPPIAKKVFSLKSEDKKHKEISQILSISTKTVEWHMGEIRKKIKKSIKNYFST
jgi:RNA polymerase sigma-70 factor (ECF subfamily)